MPNNCLGARSAWISANYIQLEREFRKGKLHLFFPHLQKLAFPLILKVGNRAL